MHRAWRTCASSATPITETVDAHTSSGMLLLQQPRACAPQHLQFSDFLKFKVSGMGAAKSGISKCCMHFNMKGCYSGVEGLRGSGAMLPNLKSRVYLKDDRGW